MRPTAHTFDQVNWDNAEQETRIGALQEMVAILLNRLDEAEAASPAALDVERLRETIHRMKWCKATETLHAFAHGDDPEDDELRARFMAEYARLTEQEERLPQYPDGVIAEEYEGA